MIGKYFKSSLSTSIKRSQLDPFVAARSPRTPSEENNSPISLRNQFLILPGAGVESDEKLFGKRRNLLA